MNNLKFLSLLLLIVTGFNGFAQDNKLNNKQIGVIGDSYVRNHKEPIEYTWHYKFAQKYNMEYHNFGRNGNCIAMDRSRFGEAMYKRYTSMPDSLDYILVIAGHNDTGLLDSIGGIDIFKEKMAILCEGLVSKYPSAKIYFFTRWVTENFNGSDAQKIVDAMIEVCGNYSIPIFDAARKGGIYTYNKDFRKMYFQSSKNDTDRAHLNAKGHDHFLNVAESFILQH
ncbi:SGNH/GDSL hydrolase family protein [Dysgonomonas sp. 216]|uniref:SGNH/GDSL hydrolase family protein n=1 Tax=Dysgonomonas sp. 216 TaxID=2302934 RepID=UPI0013CF9221|nr:SGNH/GDSL hydrolase family protein [Dysgonomonas sp. 216]NDW18809.1 SGNH/GDSL hydrolase family protein [Dysgonomonas sp. 216]